ncbi:hypothetical protein RKE29_21030 [Streptomyces sp. B1866]|uniref:hypothetical protein n=1 Tax=Streptomyces sp. B1866 TaxID=3075431 RepID=UPI00288E00AD|nr:hypothetical protein [Streptomyces sp. B1866]MDT3399099.1 hypothetical protein [Streptomyces sp. B1866]
MSQDKDAKPESDAFRPLEGHLSPADSVEADEGHRPDQRHVVADEGHRPGQQPIATVEGHRPGQQPIATVEGHRPGQQPIATMEGHRPALPSLAAEDHHLPAHDAASTLDGLRLPAPRTTPDLEIPAEGSVVVDEGAPPAPDAEDEGEAEDGLVGADLAPPGAQSETHWPSGGKG